jgi:hypothetical protein
MKNMVFNIFKKWKKSEKEFEEIEESLYKRTLYNSLKELKDIVYKWVNETREKGPSHKLQEVYLRDIRRILQNALQYASRLYDDKLVDEINDFYLTLKKLPGLTPEFDKVRMPLELETIEEIHKAVEKLLKKYEKKYKPKEEKKERKISGSEIPGIFVVLLLSFLLFLFVSFSSSTSGYFLKSSDLISISLIFSFLLALSVLLLLKNL